MKQIMRKLIILFLLAFSIHAAAQNTFKYELRALKGIRIGSNTISKIDSAKMIGTHFAIFSNGVRYYMLNDSTAGVDTAMLNLKAPISSPTFTGTVAVPSLIYQSTPISATAAEVNMLSGVNQYVQTQINTLKARIDSLANGSLGDMSMANAAELFVLKSDLRTNADQLKTFQNAGSDVLFLPASPGFELETAVTLTDARLYGALFEITYDTLITGVKYHQYLQGDFTADAYNGFAIYSVSGTTYNKVAETANDAALWKSAAYSNGSKAFASPVAVSAGLYVVTALYNMSSGATAPQIMLANNRGSLLNIAFMINTPPMGFYLAGQSSMPTSITKASVTNASPLGIWLY